MCVVLWGNFYEPVKIEQKKELALNVGRPALIGKYPGNENKKTKKKKIERKLFPVIGPFKTTKNDDHPRLN